MATFKPKILLVDDEVEARSGLAHVLRAKGYEVVEVGTGTEALARAKGEWPALIILDVVLPDIPGTEIPSFEGTRDRYFEKPGHVDELLAVVHQMLTRKT